MADAFDREERAAILEFDGGLSRAEAERSAGVSPISERMSPRAFPCRASIG